MGLSLKKKGCAFCSEAVTLCQALGSERDRDGSVYWACPRLLLGLLGLPEGWVIHGCAVTSRTRLTSDSKCYLVAVE